MKSTTNATNIADKAENNDLCALFLSKSEKKCMLIRERSAACLTTTVSFAFMRVFLLSVCGWLWLRRL
jgi:hypothetical protein